MPGQRHRRYTVQEVLKKLKCLPADESDGDKDSDGLDSGSEADFDDTYSNDSVDDNHSRDSSCTANFSNESSVEADDTSEEEHRPTALACHSCEGGWCKRLALLILCTAHATYLLTFPPEVPSISSISCVLMLVAALSLRTSAANWFIYSSCLFKKPILYKNCYTGSNEDGYRRRHSCPKERWPRFFLFPVASFEGT